MTRHSPSLRAPRRLLTAALVAAGIAAAGGRAAADGNVLRVEADRAYVDLGADDGVGAGSRLTLLHVVTARDPVTGATLRDRFPLGRLVVIKAGPRLCLVEVPESLRSRIQVGDEIALAEPRRTFVDPWQEQVERSRQAAPPPTAAPSPAAGSPDPRRAERRRAEHAATHAEAARAAWQETLGQPPAKRIAIWEWYLGARADSPYAGAVRAEIQSLRRQMVDDATAEPSDLDPEQQRARRRVTRLQALEPDLDTDGRLAGHPPRRIYQGQSIDLAFAVLAPDQVDRGWLYYRRAGEPTFRRAEMAADGDGYLRAAVPGPLVSPPAIEYFVDVARGDEPPSPAIGSESAPKSIQVEAAVEERPPATEDRSRVTVLLDYVDFDGRFADGFDQYFHGEIDFLYRFLGPVYGMRVGFGNLRGVGGPKDVIDDDPTGTCRDPSSGLYECRKIAFSYAYTEIELRAARNLAFMIRPQFGNGSIDSRPGAHAGRCDGEDTSDCDLFSALGLRARVRFGAESATNLVLGLAFTEKVGSVFEANFTWSVIPRFPVLLSAQVTDLPVPEDFGVRLIADVGWRALGWVYPSLRVSYQARDVDHSGLSGGLAANFDW